MVKKFLKENKNVYLSKDTSDIVLELLSGLELIDEVDIETKEEDDNFDGVLTYKDITLKASGNSLDSVERQLMYELLVKLNGGIVDNTDYVMDYFNRMDCIVESSVEENEDGTYSCFVFASPKENANAFNSPQFSAVGETESEARVNCFNKIAANIYEMYQAEEICDFLKEKITKENSYDILCKLVENRLIRATEYIDEEDGVFLYSIISGMYVFEDEGEDPTKLQNEVAYNLLNAII